jgi:hypothetical protein
MLENKWRREMLEDKWRREYQMKKRRSKGKVGMPGNKMRQEVQCCEVKEIPEYRENKGMPEGKQRG